MYIHDLSPIIFTVGPVSIRWYGLFFAIGILLNFLVVYSVFKREGKPLWVIESVSLYLFFGMLIGARLGHIIFYNLPYFLAHPLDILKIWEGGLASHGAAIGLLISYVIWLKVHKIGFSIYADLLVLGIPLTAGMVRIGNFFNSEIIGKPTDSSYGVVFSRLSEDFPRHPSQLYESAIAFSIFFIIYFVYRRYYKKLPPLILLFLLIFLYFSTRFIVEFWKERFILETFPLSMGQILSILPILISLFYFGWIWRKRKV